MKLGFIGTGKIASSVITGICTSKISFKKILVSPRNRIIAQKLKINYADEVRGEIDIDKNNNIYLATCTYSTDFRCE